MLTGLEPVGVKRPAVKLMENVQCRNLDRFPTNPGDYGLAWWQSRLAASNWFSG